MTLTMLNLTLNYPLDAYEKMNFCLRLGFKPVT